MLDASAADAPAAPDERKTRETLARRLADIVCLPTSRITPQERYMTGDLLVDMLSEVDVTLREKIAVRISTLPEAASNVLRWLACDESRVARPVLCESEALSDSDLIAIARSGGSEHRFMIARRREVSAVVTEALVSCDEPEVVAAVLQNREAKLSDAGVDQILRLSRDHASLARLLAPRVELRPSQGLTLFWWSEAAERKRLLLRFGADRNLLQDSASDIFEHAGAMNWSDPATRKALQFIERRQRNRAALDKSPYDSLEQAAETAAVQGMDRKLVEELSYLSGVKPAIGAKVFTDLGGEPIAVLCKATGLKRRSLGHLWTALRRRPANAETDEAFERVIDVYESLSNDKAQTILRYWNWSLTSSIAPAKAYAAGDGELENEDAFSASQRAARLVWGRRD